MLSGGMAAQFCEPSRGNPAKVLKPRLAPKGAGLGFFTSLYFGGDGLTLSHFFDGVDLSSTRDPLFLRS